MVMHVSGWLTISMCLIRCGCAGDDGKGKNFNLFVSRRDIIDHMTFYMFQSLRSNTILVASIKPIFTDSACWKAIMKVKDVHMAGTKLVLNNGNYIGLWEDPWLNNMTLENHFPILFDICQNQGCTISEFASSDYQLKFRHRLCDDNLMHWNVVVDSARTLNLSDVTDGVMWSFS